MEYSDYLTAIYQPCKLFGRKYRSNMSTLAVLNAIKILTETGQNSTIGNIRMVTCNDSVQLNSMALKLALRGFVYTTQGKGKYYHLTSAGELHLKQFEEAALARIDKLCKVTGLPRSRFGV